MGEGDRKAGAAEPLPMADPSREEMARQVFGDWESVTPEEWAGRFSHTVLCSSFDMYRYRDAGLQSWIFRLHAILADPGRVDECRRKYLTAEQIAGIGKDDF